VTKDGVAQLVAIALAVGGCGTEDWVFDAPPVQGRESGAPPIADAGELEAAPIVEASPVPDVGPGVESGLDTSRAGCASNDDCASMGLHCDLGSGECVECVADGDCGSGRICESLQCVASCADGGVCPSATPVCRALREVCVPCMTSSDCASAATGHLCLMSTGQCVGCLSNSDCREGFCDSTTNACVNQ
jgi:Cys-rich repeat protein